MEEEAKILKRYIKENVLGMLPRVDNKSQWKKGQKFLKHHKICFWRIYVAFSCILYTYTIFSRAQQMVFKDPTSISLGNINWKPMSKCFLPQHTHTHTHSPFNFGASCFLTEWKINQEGTFVCKLYRHINFFWNRYWKLIFHVVWDTKKFINFCV